MPSRHSAKSDTSDNIDQESKWDHSQRTLRAWLISLQRELPNDSSLHKSFVATRSVSSKAHTIVINKQHATDLKNGSLKAKGYGFDNPMPAGLYISHRLL